MENKIEEFLSTCSETNFGKIRLSENQKEFYQRFNDENVSLCTSLPESVQEAALSFLKRYSGIRNGEKPDYFKNYHAPSWSIIYWLVDFDHFNHHKLTEEDIQDAITAQAMAMNLHSLDDHLNDGEIPVNHLTLLLRSQSWMIMNAAWGRLASGIDGGEEIVRNFINDYYAAIHEPEAPESLVGYCDRFRNQMATWVIVPVLLSKRIGIEDNILDIIQKAYESFGIAWRLLDDIQDIGKDIMTGEHSAIHLCLPDEVRTLWDKASSQKTIEINGDAKRILDHILSDGIVERVKKKAGGELESAASIVDDIKLAGLADEFRCLLKPLKRRQNHIIKDYIQRDGRLDLSDNTLSIEVTTHCNCACTHCFVRARMEEPTSLSIDMVKDIISEGYDLGYHKLHLTGGEPLLWKGLFEALDSAIDLGYESIFLNTNGTLLTEEMAYRLACYDGLKISVSLEGREPLHDRMRGTGSHHRAMQGIERALDAGIDLCIFTTVRKSLYSYLSYFVGEVYERFPDIACLTFIQLIRVKDDLFDLSEELLTPDDFVKLVLAASLLNVYGHKTYLLNNPLATVTSKQLGIWGIPESAPLHLDGDLVILANKGIGPAHSTHSDFGRYEPGMIKSVLFSHEYRSAVAPDDTTCPICKHFRLCQENGMIRPSQWYMDMKPDVPYCRRVLDRVSL